MEGSRTHAAGEQPLACRGAVLLCCAGSNDLWTFVLSECLLLLSCIPRPSADSAGLCMAFWKIPSLRQLVFLSSKGLCQASSANWAQACNAQATATGISAPGSPAAALVQHAPLRLGLLLNAQGLYGLLKMVPVPMTAFGTALPPALPAWCASPKQLATWPYDSCRVSSRRPVLMLALKSSSIGQPAQIQ